MQKNWLNNWLIFQIMLKWNGSRRMLLVKLILTTRRKPQHPHDLPTTWWRLRDSHRSGDDWRRSFDWWWSFTWRHIKNSDDKFFCFRFPMLNSLIYRINARKRRDSLIVGLVVAVCTFLLLLYAFHWTEVISVQC